MTTDVWVASVDPEGNEVMNATFGDHTTNETACCIIQTSDGGYLVAGYSEYLSTGKSDGLVVKIDASAKEEWRRTFGGELDDVVYSAVEAANGDILVAGSTESFGNGEADGWVVRMTASGREIWNRAYGGIKTDAARDLTEPSDGIFVFAGITTYITGTDRTDTDAWLVTFNSSGETLVDMTYGGADMNASAESIVRTPDGGYLFAGSIEEYGTGDLDAWLVKVDAMGNDVWEERFGSVHDDVAHALIALSESYYAFCGTFGSQAAGEDQVSNAWVVWLSEPTPSTTGTEVIDASPPAEPDERTEEDRNNDERFEEDTSTEENASDDTRQDEVGEGEAGNEDNKEDIDREEDESEEDGDKKKDIDREEDESEEDDDKKKDGDSEEDESEEDGDKKKDGDGEEETDEREREG